MNLEEGKKAIQEQLDEIRFFASMALTKTEDIESVLNNIVCETSSSSTSSSSTSSSSTSLSSSSTSSSSSSESSSEPFVWTKPKLLSPINNVVVPKTTEVTLKWDGLGS